MVVSGPLLEETRSAFDGVAATYHRDNVTNPLLAAMRRRTVDAVTARVPPGGRLLDLGCGPGTDAVSLATAGYEVVAVDLSPAMVAEAQRRAHVAGAAGRVQIYQLGLHELAALPPGRVDAAYSDLGALNCAPDLDRLARDLADRIRPGGYLVASVIGKVCPWELAVYAWKGDWARLRVRFSPGFVAVPLERRNVWTRYLTPGRFISVFARAGFRRRALRALGLFVPPPYLNHVAARYPAGVAVLQRLEDGVGGWPGLRALGDHFLIVMERR